MASAIPAGLVATVANLQKSSCKYRGSVQLEICYGRPQPEFFNINFFLIKISYGPLFQLAKKRIFWINGPILFAIFDRSGFQWTESINIPFDEVIYRATPVTFDVIAFGIQSEVHR